MDAAAGGRAPTKTGQRKRITAAATKAYRGHPISTTAAKPDPNAPATAPKAEYEMARPRW